MILKLHCSLFLSYPHQQGCRVPAGRRLPAGHSQDTAALWPPAWGLHRSPPAASAGQLRERGTGRTGEWAHKHRQPREELALKAIEDVRIQWKKGAQGMNSNLFSSECV